MGIYKIFISSVQEEFKKERLVVKELITQNALLKKYFTVFLFEDLPAKSKSAQDIYLRNISKSDIMILILGKDYGKIGADNLSAIEKEYRKAVEKNLETLTFIKDVNNSDRDKRVLRLIKEIENPDKGYIYKTFDDNSQLKECIYNSLVEFLDEQGILPKFPFDKRICEDASYEDIKEELVWDFLETRATKLKVAVPKISIKDFLQKTVKVVKDEDGVLKPTNTAILFFCDNPQDFISQSIIKIARFRGNTRIEFIDSQELIGPIYKILNYIENFFKRNTRLASKIVEFKRVDIPEYPFEAIREAIVNAIAHRDYLRIGANIQINIFDDRIEVTSPGGLLPGLDINHLEGVHETRNKEICKIFHETKDMEKYGTGITKMNNLMNEHGLNQPALNQISNFFRVTFYGPGEKILDLVSNIPEERQTDLKELGLNERQIEALRLMVNEDEKITIRKYANFFNVSDKTVKRDLKKLVETGFVVKVGYKKGAYFEAKK
ncbi:MAG: DUF4062 domain-containing protein [Candidatus Cloacimonetes bacterium]|nr:DUF4062 domain-containing protein [Candidatus Cloacimonadota bacterium]